jgi:hypothetical protein
MPITTLEQLDGIAMPQPRPTGAATEMAKKGMSCSPGLSIHAYFSLWAHWSSLPLSKRFLRSGMTKDEQPFPIGKKTTFPLFDFGAAPSTGSFKAAPGVIAVKILDIRRRKALKWSKLRFFRSMFQRHCCL